MASEHKDSDKRSGSDNKLATTVGNVVLGTLMTIGLIVVIAGAAKGTSGSSGSGSS
ncbi:hypothetical protein KKF61_05000 [Patescibacteria group bacterium]|nr:hypothetical protein [Patescibacteria group bacterium]